jgi:phosphoglycerate dehydrogenase-like enzyme
MAAPVHVLITEPFDKDLVRQVEAASERLAVHVHPAHKSDDLPGSLLAQAEVLYTSHALPEPGAAPHLKWVQLHLAGIDRVAGHPLLQTGIEVTTLSGAASSQVAEYVLLMMLALGHRLPHLLEHQARKEWPRDRWERFSPLELWGATVGLLGYGSIGREVARMCQALGARVLAVKRDAMRLVDEGYSPEGLGDPSGDRAARLYPPHAAKRMLAECDFVVVCTPLTEETRGSIGAEILAACKRGAFLIDVSRGGVVVGEAVLAALREGQLRGAALDVFESEPLDAEDPLWSAPNVILTPHIAGDSPHYDARAVELFVENLKRYVAGQPLLNRVAWPRGY